MHYSIYQNIKPASNPWDIFCVHGLTRNGMDFDFLANSFVKDSRFNNIQVICPDVVGRGKSDWLSIKENYSYPLYCSNISSLIGACERGNVGYIGTSMGGLIGIMLASLPNCPIKKLVLNDIGPFVPKEPQLFISSYVSNRPASFENFDQALKYLKDIHKSFGLSDEHFKILAKSTFKEVENGRYEFFSDFGISVGHSYKQESDVKDISLWSFWDQIKIPVMLIRGKESTLLPTSIVDQMKERGPGISAFLEVEGVGHAPSLFVPEQINPIKEFFLK